MFMCFYKGLHVLMPYVPAGIKKTKKKKRHVLSSNKKKRAKYCERWGIILYFLLSMMSEDHYKDHKGLHFLSNKKSSIILNNSNEFSFGDRQWTISSLIEAKNNE